MRLIYTPEELAARRKAENDAGREINHIGEARSVGMSDIHVCSCGWESGPYHDGDVWAREDWVAHIRERGAEIAYPERLPDPL